MNSHPLGKQFYQFATTRESYQKIRLSLYISWEPGSQVPKEFAALVSIGVKVEVEIVIEVGIQHLARMMGGGLVVGLMLNSTQVEVKIKVALELGNKKYETSCG